MLKNVGICALNRNLGINEVFASIPGDSGKRFTTARIRNYYSSLDLEKEATGWMLLVQKVMAATDKDVLAKAANEVANREAKLLRAEKRATQKSSVKAGKTYPRPEVVKPLSEAEKKQQSIKELELKLAVLKSKLAEVLRLKEETTALVARLRDNQKAAILAELEQAKTPETINIVKAKVGQMIAANQREALALAKALADQKRRDEAKRMANLLRNAQLQAERERLAIVAHMRQEAEKLANLTSQESALQKELADLQALGL